MHRRLVVRWSRPWHLPALLLYGYQCPICWSSMYQCLGAQGRWYTVVLISSNQINICPTLYQCHGCKFGVPSICPLPWVSCFHKNLQGRPGGFVKHELISPHSGAHPSTAKSPPIPRAHTCGSTEASFCEYVGGNQQDPGGGGGLRAPTLHRGDPKSFHLHREVC